VSWDAGYPKNYPTPYDWGQNYVQVFYGVGFIVNSISGNYRLDYSVFNQPGRHAKFQVMVLNATNWQRYLNGFSYQCVNSGGNQCNLITTDPITGNISGFLNGEGLVFVVRNRNLIDPANIVIGWRIVGGSSTSGGSSGSSSGSSSGFVLAEGMVAQEFHYSG